MDKINTPENKIVLPEEFLKAYWNFVKKCIQYRREHEKATPDDWEPSAYTRSVEGRSSSPVTVWHHSDVDPKKITGVDKHIGYITHTEWDTALLDSSNRPHLDLYFDQDDGTGVGWGFFNREQIIDFLSVVRITNPSVTKEAISRQFKGIPFETYVGKYEQGIGGYGCIVGVGYNHGLVKLVNENRMPK